jgi:methionyl-tRNA synthetase
LAEKTFYLTTPIYYVNAEPHIGNASTTIVADVISRFQRQRGRKTFFLTGTDEHALKVMEAAQEHGMDPKSYADMIAPRFAEAWREADLQYDDFIRTTEPRHIKVVQAVFERLRAQGDLYKGAYQGWYCVSDETFFRESEVVDGKCPNPECGKPVRWVEEENYYFRLSAYQDRLLDYIEKNPDFLQPDYRRNEVISFIKQGLQDVSVTRVNRGWGIPVPGEPDKVVYVWMDALLNYLTAAGYLSDDDKFKELWPPDLQLMAKDIFVRFHSTFWPAMLMALEVPLPKVLFGHGFWTIDGRKIGKSLGNAIAPAKIADELAAKSGCDRFVAVDAIRYYMLREVPFGLDGDFSNTGLIKRFNSDLANDLGNLLNRSLSMVHRYFGGVLSEPANGSGGELRAMAESVAVEVESAFDQLKFSQGLESIWRLVSAGNKFVEDNAPWNLYKEGNTGKLAEVLYNALETARIVSVMITSVMPHAAAQMQKQLAADDECVVWSESTAWGRLRTGVQLGEPKPIFPRIEENRAESTAKPKKQEERNMITYEEFKKLDIRIAEVKSAEKVEGADKLLKLIVDDGEGERQIIAGIAQWYDPDSLVGKKIVLLANLQPAVIRGIESNGMLLAADIDGRAVILMPDQDVPAGSKVR